MCPLLLVDLYHTAACWTWNQLWSYLRLASRISFVWRNLLRSTPVADFPVRRLPLPVQSGTNARYPAFCSIAQDKCKKVAPIAQFIDEQQEFHSLYCGRLESSKCEGSILDEFWLIAEMSASDMCKTTCLFKTFPQEQKKQHKGTALLLSLGTRNQSDFCQRYWRGPCLRSLLRSRLDQKLTERSALLFMSTKFTWALSIENCGRGNVDCLTHQTLSPWMLTPAVCYLWPFHKTKAGSEGRRGSNSWCSHLGPWPKILTDLHTLITIQNPRLLIQHSPSLWAKNCMKGPSSQRRSSRNEETVQRNMMRGTRELHPMM